MVANNHWAAGRKTAELSEFSEEDWVLPGRELSPDYLDGLTGLCMAHGFHPRVRHHVGSTLRQMAFAACGQGIALVPEWFSLMRPPTLSVVTLSDVDAVIALTAAWNAGIESPQRDAALRFIGDKKSPAQNAEF